MSLKLHEIARRQFERMEPHIRLVIVHPNLVQQHPLLDDFLRDQGSVYVRLEGYGLTHPQLEQALNQAAETQRAALEGATYVVVDEADRAASDGLETFVLSFLDRMPNSRMALLSRHVPSFVQLQPRVREVACFIPVDPTLLLADYARRDTSSVLLEVSALGSGRVLLNGRNVDDWDGTLPRALFFYLVDRGMTTRSQIFETFWPNLSTREATNVFHVTKRKISEVLGVDLTVYWSGFYRISPSLELHYDAARFSELVQSSAVVPAEEAIPLLKNAIALYRGEFLNSITMEWVQRRRQEMTQTYGDALVGLAKLMEQADKLNEALGLYIRASATNPQREDLARSIMLLYHRLGMSGDALATYKRLEAELEQKLGVSPARSLQDLAQEIQSEAEQVA